MEEKIKVLFISSLFPNRESPTLATFNKQQIMYLSEFCVIKVVAPIMWFPFLKRSKISYHEFLGDIEVFHPKAFYIPKFARFLYGLFYFLSIIRCIKRILKNFDFEIIYTNWLYPDSFAAMLIARLFQKPFVVCALGTDVNVYMKYPLRKRMILTTIRKSAKTLTVSKALKEKIVEQGIPSEHIEVLYDGVDKKIFSPQDKNRIREKLGLEKTFCLILYVGNLKIWKGVDYLIDALKILVSQKKEIKLCLIGDGSERKRLEKKVMKQNLCNRVYFKGRKEHKDISLWMNASNLLCLPSLMEGVPNVMLEAWACGIPVVATKVGGIQEILDDQNYGIMVEPQDSVSLAQALLEGLSKNWDKEKIKQHSLKFSWEENAKKLFKILKLEITRDVASLEKRDGRVKKEMKYTLSSIIPKRWIIWQGNVNLNQNRIAITFDDGPNPEFTPKILDLLNQYKIKATFFLIGEEVERYQDLAKRILNEKHCIGNHSYSHRRLVHLNSVEIEKEILKTQQVLKDILGCRTRLFRPPFGRLQLNSLITSIKLNLTTVLYSLDSMDWKKMNRELILERLNSNMVKTGDIILFHDDNEFTLEALPPIIESLQDKGYSFTTIDEFLSKES